VETFQRETITRSNSKRDGGIHKNEGEGLTTDKANGVLCNRTGPSSSWMPLLDIRSLLQMSADFGNLHRFFDA